MNAPVAVILAAGKSTRMKSELPKVLHEVCGRPMIDYVLDAARAAGAQRLVVVVGHKAELVRQALAGQPGIEFALQAEQRGTGHAVMVCRAHLERHDGPVLVLAGDTPLLRSDSLRALLDEQRQHQAACVVGTAVTDANEGLGRIVRDPRGEFVKIVEHRDATPAERAIREINTGCYAFDGRSLLDALTKIRPENDQAEYYLTDCAAVLKNDGRRVVASPRLDIVEAMGVNTRNQLADVQRAIQRECQQRLMAEGVSIVAPEQTAIDPRATIGRDTIIYPFTAVLGPAVIGADCRLGPHAVIRGTAKLADGTVVEPFQVAD
jgi:bifunctional UDP-N-acetylglucosamine pyrophosphorylase/glucosamine-1-phosphate N-acetyltransferase